MSDSAFIKLALERFQLAAEAEASNRRDSLDDLKFSVGEQWDAAVKSQRETEGRPCLVMNRTQQMIRQVVNEQRQQRPAVQINPVGGGADKDTAEIEQGIVRHIEVNSDAEIAYDHAFELMVRTGWGDWRILTEVVDDGSNEQEIKIKRIKNNFSVYFDPACSEPDFSDARYAFIVEDLQHEEYKSRFGKSKAASRLSDLESVGDIPPGWMDETFIRVAEYYYIDGKDEAHRPIVKWALINCIETLKKTTWPGRWIPIIRVVGDDLQVDGKRYLAGLVRMMKGPQMQYNFMRSAAVEQVALGPKAPWLAAEGQIEGHEEEWRTSNRKNHAVLVYKSTDVAGKPIPPPQRNVVEPPIQATALMCQMADDDLMATAGVNIERLGGDKGSEKSGRAILARQQQSQVATSNFSDNLARAMRFNARQLIDLIPHIYDVTRIQRIINPDGSVDNIVIHNGAGTAQEAKQIAQQNAIMKVFDVTVGRYDVTVSVGPSYQTRRQEAFAMQTELLKIVPPELAKNVMDLVVANSDMPGADQIAKRWKKMLPPEMADDNQMDADVQLQKTRAQLQAAMQQHELLTRALNEATEVIKQKRIEAASKKEITELQERTKILVAEINTKAQEVATRMKMEQEQWLALHGSAHDFAKDAAGSEIDSAEAERGREHEKEMQAGQQGHEAGMAERQAELAQSANGQ